MKEAVRHGSSVGPTAQAAVYQDAEVTIKTWPLILHFFHGRPDPFPCLAFCGRCGHRAPYLVIWGPYAKERLCWRCLLSEYGQGIEPRLRDYYTAMYGPGFWERHRDELLQNTLAKISTVRTERVKYNHKDRRNMERHPLLYPHYQLVESGVVDLILEHPERYGPDELYYARTGRLEHQTMYDMEYAFLNGDAVLVDVED